MQMVLKLGNADKIEAIATITMTLGEWKDLRDQLREAWPASVLDTHIGQVISEAEKMFYAHD